MSIEKIVKLEELAKTIADFKAKGKKVALCHGVFDLLHVGHIRHFKAASKFGDALVVTVTPDKYVKKGPNRPAFNEKLRAEALASLSFVDYVAINKWPTAEETIKLLKPNFYVKGMDYSDPEKDISKGIVAEENAIKKVGGEFKFTDEITFSSSSLLNQYMHVFPKEVTNYLADFSKRYSSEDVISYLEKIKNLKILVIGEAIIDEYQYGESIGKAGKESIIALKYIETEKFAGGTLAIANHLANFCDAVTLFTLLGEKDSQEDFISKKLNKKIKKIFHYKKDSPTIVKRRFIEFVSPGKLQKLLEFYLFNGKETEAEQSKALAKKLEEIIPEYDLVLVADFGHGMLNKELRDTLVKNSKFLAVNTQSNAGNLGYNTISKYSKVDYICIDEPEIRLENRDKEGDLTELISKTVNGASCNKAVITRGKNGCMCYSNNGIIKIPAFSETVLDTMGAGDAFLSLTAPLATNDVPMEVIGFIGNVVGSLAVNIIGNKESIDKISLYKSIVSIMK